ncbi:MAG TPA: tetratricopeptide repeat protein [Roseiflexaceae bacterium]|nr:tetratricopeptide repeat protein [Roseiflexaceae bacterium]
MARTSLQAAYDQARRWIESNDADRAIGLAQHILEQHPNNLETYRILGEAYLASRQLERAQESFERVLHSDPENIPAHVGLGIAFERQGRLDRAIPEIEQAWEIKPEMPELRTQLLRLYSDAWGSENAQLRLSRAGLARLYAKGHMLAQAIGEFRQVITDQPQRYDAKVALAEALWRDGQEDEAVALSQEILRERPETLKAHLLLGYIALAGGRAEGQRSWSRAAEMDPYQTVARAMFETLPQAADEEPTVEEWDEEAWQAQRLRAQEELEAATRPMPVAAALAGAQESSWLEATNLPPRPSTPARPNASMDMDDFLAGLLASSPANLPETDDAPVSTVELDLPVEPFSFDNLNDPSPRTASGGSDSSMAPFSLADLGLSDDEIASLDAIGEEQPAQSSASTQPATPQPAARKDDEPVTEPFSLADLGLSDDEIASLDELNAEPKQTQQPATQNDEPVMEPFSFADLGLSDDELASLDELNATEPKQTQQPATKDDEPVMEPFSFADLGLSDDEIASLDELNATEPKQTQQPATKDDEPVMAPFSFADLGLSDDEIASLDALNATEPKQTQPATTQDDEPVMAPFSFADLGLSDDEIASLDELNATEPKQTQPATTQDDEPVMEPFSFADLGLSDDEIASLGELNATEPTRQQPAAQDDEPTLAPFSFADLGLSDDEIANLDALGNQTEPTVLPPAPPTPGRPSRGDEEFGELPLDLRPFSLDELDLSATDESGQGGLPPSLQAFTIDEPVETPAPRDPMRIPIPPVSSNTSDSSDAPDIDDDPAFQTGGYSWQQPPQRATTNFNPPKTEEQGDDVSIFAKLRQRRQEAPIIEDEQPLTNEIDDDPRLFSMDDVSLRDDEPLSSAPAAPTLLTPAAPEAPAEAAPPAPAKTEQHTHAPAQEIESSSIEEALASGEVQPFSFADLGLSEEELAALGLGPSVAASPAAPAYEPEPEPEPVRTAEPPAVEARAPEPEPEPVRQPEQHTPAPQAESLSDALAAGEVQPFSFADLGLSEEELAALGLNDSAPAASTATPTQELDELEPFSLQLDELLSDNTSVSTPEPTPPAATAPAAQQPAAQQPAAPAAPEEVEETALLATELKPFSLSDLGLSDEEVAALGLGGPVDLDEPRRQGLGITEEELASLDLDDMNWPSTEPTAPASAPVEAAQPEQPELEVLPEITPFDLSEHLNLEPEQAESTTIEAEAGETGDPVVDRLIGLGRHQGYVDISDIIAGVENPEAEEDRIEEIGRMLHEARIEIRDGDEVIDMDADYEEEPEYPGFEEPASNIPATAPPTPADDDQVLSPFSLSELGLSDEEIAALGFDTQEPARPAPQPAPAEEEDLTPFSLSELGLSDEEIAALGLADQTPTPAPEPPRPSKPQTTPFNLDDLSLPDDPIPTPQASAPAQTPTPAEEEEDLTPFSLSELGLSDEEIAALGNQGAPASPEPPIQPFDLEDLLEPGLGLDLEPPASSQPQTGAGLIAGGAAAGAAAQTPAPRAPEAVPPTPEPVRTTPEPVRSTPAPTPTPAATPAPRAAAPAAADLPPAIQAYVQRIQAEPNNHGLRLAVARTSSHIGLIDLAAQQYRQLIRQNSMLDQVVEDLIDLMDYIDDPHALQRLHRMLGDAYSKQGLLNEAIAEYNWTPSGQ